VPHSQPDADLTKEERVGASGYLIAILFFLGGCAFVFGGLVTANLLNAIFLRGRSSRNKRTIYESGETPIGSAWVQFPLAFYVFALLFVAFDVDIFFILTLALGLVYAWRKGVIRWI
jgi:NADH:ubiquinone oxidoreductase subunit 3 (subunit A)